MKANIAPAPADFCCKVPTTHSTPLEKYQQLSLASKQSASGKQSSYLKRKKKEDTWTKMIPIHSKQLMYSGEQSTKRRFHVKKGHFHYSQSLPILAHGWQNAIQFAANISLNYAKLRKPWNWAGFNSVLTISSCGSFFVCYVGSCSGLKAWLITPTFKPLLSHFLYCCKHWRGLLIGLRAWLIMPTFKPLLFHFFYCCKHWWSLLYVLSLCKTYMICSMLFSCVNLKLSFISVWEEQVFQ